MAHTYFFTYRAEGGVAASETTVKASERKQFLSYLGQISKLVGIQQKLLQTPSVAIDLIGHIEQGAVAFIDRFNVTVAPPQGDAVKHHGRGGGGNKSRTRAINKQRRGEEEEGRGGGHATDCCGGTVLR